MDTQIHMHGNLVADPAYRTVGDGLHMTKFRLASSGRRFDRARNEFVNTDPVYMSVVCWRQLADNVAKTLRKGDTVVVHGRLVFREYDDGNGGPRRQTYEIEAAVVGPDLARYRAELTRPLRDVEPAAPGATADPAGRPAAAVGLNGGMTPLEGGPLVPEQATDPFAAPLTDNAA